MIHSARVGRGHTGWNSGDEYIPAECFTYSSWSHERVKNPEELAFSLLWLQQTGTFSLISVCLMLKPHFVWLRSYWQRAEAAVMCSSLLMWICSCYHSTEYDGAFSSYTASISLHFLPLFYHLLLIISKQDKIQFNLKIVWGPTRLYI